FYRKRIVENRPVIFGFLGSMEIVIQAEQPWLEAFCRIVYRWGIQDFNLRYFDFIAKSFVNTY
ncbi:MAG: hypothetical protein KGZ56_10245, partial [Dethiobacter sp.]|nr:hypothetical protein [Dethiobacter sp.]